MFLKFNFHKFAAENKCWKWSKGMNKTLPNKSEKLVKMSFAFEEYEYNVQAFWWDYSTNNTSDSETLYIQTSNTGVFLLKHKILLCEFTINRHPEGVSARM